MKKLRIILLSIAITLTLSATSSYAQTASSPASTSTSKPLSDQKLRVALARTQDALIFANTKLSACQEAVDAYKVNSEDDEAVKTKLTSERNTYKNLVELLTNQAAEYKASLEQQKLATASADKRADNAEKEVVVQKKKVSFWKKAARYTFVIGAAAGAGAVILLQK